jgi:hypothetical protein
MMSLYLKGIMHRCKPLTNTDWVILDSFCDLKEKTQGDLVALGWHKSQVSKTLSKLVKLEWITKLDNGSYRMFQVRDLNPARSMSEAQENDLLTGLGMMVENPNSLAAQLQSIMTENRVVSKTINSGMNERLMATKLKNFKF